MRALAWSADKGLTLNGKTYKLAGGCIHDDNGVLGACAFDRAEERKVELLKAAGFNALRTAHNPPSPALLDACDRLGMLVLDEAFDCWVNGKNTYDYHVVFKDWWQRDIDSMVMRDRNHPAVVMWSIGNEIPGVYDAMGNEYSPKAGERNPRAGHNAAGDERRFGLATRNAGTAKSRLKQSCFGKHRLSPCGCRSHPGPCLLDVAGHRREQLPHCRMYRATRRVA